jgi:uncharacterized protein
MTTVSDRAAMISGMRPELMPGHFHFCTVTNPAQIDRAMPDALACFREVEGMSMILPETSVRVLGLAQNAPHAPDYPASVFRT